METIEQQRTEARPTSSLALVVICLGYFLVIAAGAFLAGAVITYLGVARSG
jgi:hypothetical protein